MAIFVFENRVQRRTIRSKRDGVVGSWRKQLNEEFNILHSSPSIIRKIKGRRIRWTGHVARMRHKRDACRIWCESQKERDHSDDPGVDERIRLK
jgi:hypothetical protein